jgi:cytochrome d ubiquinol oxidase subunit I
MFSMAMWMAACVAPLQIVAGDLHGLNTLEHQPTKVAAMEGHFEAEQQGAPLILFGWPDMDAAETKYALSIPKLGSLILKHDPNATIRGLESWPREDWPRVPIVFWSFRVMVGLGFLMVFTGLVSLFLRWRGTLYDTRWFARLGLVMGPSGFVALLAGWFVTETGRQPFTVYGVLRTVDSVSPIASPALAGSLLAFVGVYLIVFGAGVWYLLHLIGMDPDKAAVGEVATPAHAAGLHPGPAMDAKGST